MESLIPIVTVLFMLSLVCERVAELVKNLLSNRKMLWMIPVGNMTTKGLPDSPAEADRLYRILKVNMICGFVTAVACHASMFDIIKHFDNPSEVFDWPDEIICRSIDAQCIGNFIMFLVGCFLTGAFISLGSRFWHDVLDIILEFKNGKRQDTIQKEGDFDSLEAIKKNELMKSAIQELKPDWKNNFKNYRGVSIGNKLTGTPGNWKDTGKPTLRFSVSKKESFSHDALNRIPSFISYRGFNIPTDIIETGVAKSSSAVSPGANIARDKSHRSGTYGALVSYGFKSNKKYYGVSCYHVLFADELSASVKEVTPDLAVSNPDVYSPGNTTGTHGSKLGKAVEGVFNEFVDIGFFETDLQHVDSNTIKIGKPKGVHHVVDGDKGKLRVKFFGATSGEQSGLVMSVKSDQFIEYRRTNGGSPFDHEIKDLIELKITSDGGDSGAVVMTEGGNEIIGVLVATAGPLAYVIPARSIEHQSKFIFEI